MPRTTTRLRNRKNSRMDFPGISLPRELIRREDGSIPCWFYRPLYMAKLHSKTSSATGLFLRRKCVAYQFVHAYLLFVTFGRLCGGFLIVGLVCLIFPL